MLVPNTLQSALVVASAAVWAKPRAVVTKRGFVSLTRARVAEIRLSDLQNIPVDDIDLAVLKQCGVVSTLALAAKVVLSGEISRKVVLKGIGATKGAKAAIEAAGGSIEAA